MTNLNKLMDEHVMLFLDRISYQVFYDCLSVQQFCKHNVREYYLLTREHDLHRAAMFGLEDMCENVP